MVAHVLRAGEETISQESGGASEISGCARTRTDGEPTREIVIRSGFSTPKPESDQLLKPRDRSSELRMAPSRPFLKRLPQALARLLPDRDVPRVVEGARIVPADLIKNTGNRLKQQLVDSETGDVVESADKGRGYEIGRNQCVPAWDRGCLLRAPLSPSAACLSPRGPW